jgi:hypothetical protein
MIRFNLHSIIDVITNSSTEIYTFARSDAVEKSYELLNEILKVSGSDKKAEDLFNVRIEPDDDIICDWFDGIEDEIDDFNISDEEKVILKKYFEIEGYEEQSKYYEENVKDIILSNPSLWENEENIEAFVCIDAKDKSVSDKDIWSMFFNTFSQEASYNG